VYQKNTSQGIELETSAYSTQVWDAGLLGYYYSLQTAFLYTLFSLLFHGGCSTQQNVHTCQRRPMVIIYFDMHSLPTSLGCVLGAYDNLGWPEYRLQAAEQVCVCSLLSVLTFSRSDFVSRLRVSARTAFIVSSRLLGLFVFLSTLLKANVRTSQ